MLSIFFHPLVVDSFLLLVNLLFLFETFQIVMISFIGDFCKELVDTFIVGEIILLHYLEDYSCLFDFQLIFVRIFIFKGLFKFFFTLFQIFQRKFTNTKENASKSIMENELLGFFFNSSFEGYVFVGEN